MKKILLLLSTIFISFTASLRAQSPTIIESGGWLESAYVKWEPIANVDSFCVYYSGEGITNKQIDAQLIRKYETYFRADVLGLKAGTYTLKVVSVLNNTEGEGTNTASLTVKAHDRSGFAHAANSPQKTASGAYNEDGTLKAGAEVIYVTPLNAKSLDIYTNNLKPREKKNAALNPLAIRFIGTIKQADMPEVNSAGLIQLKGNAASYNQQVTFEGVGDDTYLEFGLDIVRCGNVEIRNLGFKKFKEDGISIQSNNANIWIHNNDFFYGQNGGGDKKKGDGATDIKDSQWCTVSYNHYWDSGKANLFGNSDDTIDYITYHHNFLDHSDSRHPRVRCAQRVHVYNNYFCGVGKYGIGAARKSSIFVESNYFENSKNPMLSSKQGTDILDGDGSGTFSGEDGGIIKAYNNTIVGLRGNYWKWQASGQQSTEFDAYEVTNRSDEVPATVKAKQGGHTYSNFDQNLGYTPLLDTPEQAKINVETYAGRVNGGDMKITFGSTDYLKVDDPDPAIKSLIDGHVCLIVRYYGGSSGSGGGTGPVDPESGLIHNFTTQGTTSSFYTITGSLATSKGSIIYKDMTLSQYLKVESSTRVTFIPEDAGTLTLVFNTAGKTIKINGEEKTPDSNGIVTMNIAKDANYEIARGSGESYLYYIIVAYASGSSHVVNPAAVGLRLYPNPVMTTLNIASESKIENVEIYSIAGILVQQATGNLTTVDVSNLNAGSYIVKIKTAEGINSRIIMKK